MVFSPFAPPDPWRPTRRMLMASALGLVTPSAIADELPHLGAGRYQFVRFEPRPIMSPLELRDLRGRPATLDPSGRNAHLLYVWATWCPSCPVELPRLARAQEAVARLGVKVTTVSIDTRPGADVMAYLRRHEATGLRVLQDPDASTLSADRPDGASSPFHRWSMPLTFAIDRTGRVRGYIAGGIDWLEPDGSAFLTALNG
ncbi:TlpA disulfide reductase family protein [Methylorubrum populi]|uniref:Thioredoxin domain-containing protein n=2 Tax=Methylorubrum populi TaxID=223967 RepID=A0A833J1A2_9HYPH|nr:hypothetical protein F8B43_5550 [Methylorubrum populi]